MEYNYYVLRDIMTKEILAFDDQPYNLTLSAGIPEATEVVPVVISLDRLKGFLNELLSEQTTS